MPTSTNSGGSTTTFMPTSTTDTGTNTSG
jgi:hypothetical protein